MAGPMLSVLTGLESRMESVGVTKPEELMGTDAGIVGTEGIDDEDLDRRFEVL